MDGEPGNKVSTDPSFFHKRAVVKEIAIFVGLNWLTVNRIARKVELVEFRKGDMICRQGAPADAFYGLVSGRVCSYHVNAAGHREGSDFLVRGMHFGTMSALTGENHSHSYQAVNDSVVLRINKDDFAELLKVTPKLALALSLNLSQKARGQSGAAHSAHENALISVYSSVVDPASAVYAANLARALKSQGEKNRVLLLRFSSDVNSHLPDLSDIVSNHQHALHTVHKDKEPFHLLAVRYDPQDHNVLGRIGQFAGAFVRDYDHIIFDLPGEMDEVVRRLLLQSDVIHLVVRGLEEEMELARRTIETLSLELKDDFNPEKVQAIISGPPKDIALKPEEVRKALNYSSFVILPYLDPVTIHQEAVIDGVALAMVDAGTEYTLAVERLGRQVSGRLIGLVLGGGAALGMAHIGVIRVLEREKVPVDIVIGSSMGALVGALWLTGYNADGLEKVAREFSSKAGMLKLFDPPVQRGLILLGVICLLWIFGFNLLAAFLIFTLIPLGVIPVSGVVKGKAIAGWLRSKYGRMTFHDTRLPLRIVGYDLLHRRDMVIDQGLITDAVFKSIAIPGIIPPAMESGQMIIDGGVLNPLPVNVLTAMGIKRIIAVNVLQSPGEVCWGEEWEFKRYRHLARVPFARHPFKYLALRLGSAVSKFFTPNIADIIVRTLQASEYVFAETSGKQASVLIHPDLRGIQWFELYEVDKLIRRGHNAAMEHLPAIKTMLNR